MSFVDFREITVDNPGTSIRYGGNDLKEVMQVLNAKIVPNRQVKILNPWKFDTFLEMKNQAVSPADPATDYVRMYPKAIDANNNGLFGKTKENGSVVEIRVW